ncbi:hypothetical protein F0562_028031 [Nyssa sinensis]|uniref:Uncharacterized protein n=1 Tax=Nyssa sinensis TaxID=561372 RepID=A0A5J5B5D3_9ASTE|nr:hypothetical protein F0562_028031 [Nyssa sinensis]
MSRRLPWCWSVVHWGNWSGIGLKWHQVKGGTSLGSVSLYSTDLAISKIRARRRVVAARGVSSSRRKRRRAIVVETDLQAGANYRYQIDLKPPAKSITQNGEQMSPESAGFFLLEKKRPMK